MGLTRSGRYVDKHSGVPSLQDIAFQLARIPRYGGATPVIWTVAQHSLLVADLLPGAYRIYGLLHDSTESVMGDVIYPFKTEDFRVVETRVLNRIYDSLRAPRPSAEAVRLVHKIDHEAAQLEIATFFHDFHYDAVEKYLEFGERRWDLATMFYNAVVAELRDLGINPYEERNEEIKEATFAAQVPEVRQTSSTGAPVPGHSNSSHSGPIA